MPDRRLLDDAGKNRVPWNIAASVLQSCIVVCEMWGSVQIMPTVLRIGRYRFAFFSNENHEPPHVHVKAADDQAKFWLDPIELLV